VTETLLRERMSSFLQAAGQPEVGASEAPSGLSFDLFRFLYLEGGVTVVRDGLEVVRAERLFFSPAEDRLTLEDMELRLFSTTEPGRETLITVRGDSIVRRKARWTGRDLSVTTCTAGEPHVEVFAGEVEIIERGNEFEIRSRGNHLAFSGVRVLPLPDISYFTGEQNGIPIQGISGGYSDAQGFEAAVGLGGSMNQVGGALHEFLTGRPAEDFRGDWNLDLAYVEERGFPLNLRLNYRGGDLYFGSSEIFYLNDSGTNIREITNRLDGSLIDNTDRLLIHTENRVFLGAGTDLDLTLFYASDPAVYSEFFGRDYREERLPETSAYLKSAEGNQLFTIKGRWNLDDFSYKDTRAQDQFFVEQLPLATYDWFSEPILDMPWDAPLQLTSSTSLGQLRRNFDSTVPVIPLALADSTWRFDQELELASPFWIGDFGFRPFASARYTYYENTPSGTSDDRWAFAAGISAGTRLSRTWSWLNGEGTAQSMRHIIAPRVAFIHRFRVDGIPTDFVHDDGSANLLAFDSVDRLDEGALIQLQLMNILESKDSAAEGSGIGRFLWLDLIQNVHPIANRDNNGSLLGLLEYDLVIRPTADWIPIPDLSLLIEGEWDHDRDETRTLNTAVNFGKVIGVNWFAEYRTDSASEGTIGYGAGTDFLGRWELNGGSQYDRELNKSINYAANLVRHDHDWSVFLRVDFDNISGATSISLNFEPNLGGLFRSRRERSLYAGRLYGGGGGTIF
jgi:hypothetical protein